MSPLKNIVLLRDAFLKRDLLPLKSYPTSVSKKSFASQEGQKRGPGNEVEGVFSFPDPDAPQLQAPLPVFVQQAAAAKMIG